MNSILAQDGQGSGLDADLVRGLPAEFSSYCADNGYQKLPSGIIIQWGTGKTEPIAGIETRRGEITVQFPIAFPNTAWTAVASSIPYDKFTYPRVLGIADLNNINMRVVSTTYEYTPTINPLASFSYIAIGC